MTLSALVSASLVATLLPLTFSCAPGTPIKSPPAAATLRCRAPWRISLDEVVPPPGYLDVRRAPPMWVDPDTGDVEIVVDELAGGGGALRSAVWISESPGRWRQRGAALDVAQEPVAIAGDFLAIGQHGYRGEPTLTVRVYRHALGRWRPYDALPHASVASVGLGIDAAGRLTGFFGDDRGEGRLRHRTPDGTWTEVTGLPDGLAAGLTPRALAYVRDGALFYLAPDAAAERVTSADDAPRGFDDIVLAATGPAAILTDARGQIVAHVRRDGRWSPYTVASDPPREPWPDDCELDCPPTTYTAYAPGGLVGDDAHASALLFRSRLRATRTIIHGSTGSMLTEHATLEATALIVVDLATGLRDELALARPLAPTRLTVATGPDDTIHVLAEAPPSSLRHLVLTCAP